MAICLSYQILSIIVWNVLIDITKVWKSLSIKPFKTIFKLGPGFHSTSMRNSKCGKIRTRKTPYLVNFYPVCLYEISKDWATGIINHTDNFRLLRNWIKKYRTSGQNYQHLATVKIDRPPGTSSATQNTAILPNFLVFKFCGNVQFWQNFQWFAQKSVETVRFHRISTPGN